MSVVCVSQWPAEGIAHLELEFVRSIWHSCWACSLGLPDEQHMFLTAVLPFPTQHIESEAVSQLKHLYMTVLSSVAPRIISKLLGKCLPFWCFFTFSEKNAKQTNKQIKLHYAIIPNLLSFYLFTFETGSSLSRLAFDLYVTIYWVLGWQMWATNQPCLDYGVIS